MKATRARKDKILIALNTLGGRVVDMDSLGDGKAVVYDSATNRYTHVEFPSGGGVSPYPTVGDFPPTGSAGQLYQDESTGNVYCWNSSGEKYEAIGGVSDWADIQNKPTTISGFGITDAYTKTEIGDPYRDFVQVFEEELNA